MGANLILVALSFLNNKLVYVYLDSESNGVYFLAMRLSLFIALLFGDWLRLSTMNLAGEDRRLHGVLSANILWYSAVLGVALTLTATLLFPRAGFVLFSIPSAFVAAAAAAAAIAVFRDSSQSLLLVNQHHLSYGATFVVLGTVFLALDFVFLVVFHLGIRAVIAAWITATAVSALWAYLANASGGGISLRPSWAVFGRSREIGFRAFLAVIGMFLMINIHSFAIEPVSRKTGEGLVMVAMFSVCFRVFQLFQRVADVTGSHLLSYVVQRDRETGFRMTARSARGVFFFSCAAAFIALLFGKYLVLIVADSRYSPAHIPLLVMLPGMIAVNTGSVLNNFYWGNRYPFRIILAPVAAAALGLALDVLLFPRMGMSGVTLSFSLASAAWMAYVITMFCRDSGMRLSEFFFPSAEELRGAAEILAGPFRRRPR
jgi:O-antigen/teichoic acid export membrane protein